MSGNRVFANNKALFLKKKKERKKDRCLSFISYWTSGQGSNPTGTSYIFAAVVSLFSPVRIPGELF